MAAMCRGGAHILYPALAPDADVLEPNGNGLTEVISRRLSNTRSIFNSHSPRIDCVIQELCAAFQNRNIKNVTISLNTIQIGNA